MLATVPGGTHRWRWPTALFCLTFFALIVRWYYVSTALVIHPVRGDATQYVSYAWNLLTHGTFAKDLPGLGSITPDSYRDPGYPFFLALLMKAFGTEDVWYASVLLCQALLGALTVALTTQLGKFWLSSRWALAAGVLMAVWPHSVSITGFLLSETLLSFLCAAALLAFAIASRRGSNYWGFSSGLIFGAAALTNAVLLPFGVVLAALIAWRRLAARPLCAALAIGALLLPGCWALRNSQLPPSASSGSSLDRALQNFAQGASPDFHAAYRDSFFGDTAEKARAAATLSAVNAQYALLRKSLPEGFRAFLGQVEKQPARYLFWYFVKKPHELWGWSIVIGQNDIYVYATLNSPFGTQRAWIAIEAVCQALNPLLMLMMVGGVFFGFAPSLFKAGFGATANRGALMAVICMSAFVTLVYSLLQAEPRYSVPFRPMEILLATTALAGALNFWRRRTSPTDQVCRSSQSAILDLPPHSRQPQS